MNRARIFAAIIAGLAISAVVAGAVLAAAGDITTVAGGFIGDGGPATSASLNAPIGATVDASGNLFIADTSNHRIRRVDAVTKVITTVAGDGTAGFSGDGGPATNANLSAPSGVAVDGAGNLFIADSGNQRVRRVDGSTGVITTVAGTGTRGFSGDGGPATTASLNAPIGATVDASGNLFIVDFSNHRVRRVDGSTGVITTVAGTGAAGFSGDGGPATSASLSFPRGVAVDASGNLFIVDQTNHRVRRVDGATGVITTVAGTGTKGFSGDGGPATSASLSFPRGVVVDASGNLYIADTDNHRVRRVNGATGVITTVAGTGTNGFSGDGGPATSASLGFPRGVAVDASGNLFIADTSNHRIRRVDAATSVITTVVGGGIGEGVPATSASLNSPLGVAVDASGNLFIADSGNHRVRRVDGATVVIATVAGSGTSGFSGDGGPATSASLNSPQGVAVDGAGNLFIADFSNHRIRRVDAATGVITTVAGTGVAGFSGDGGPATSASLGFPRGVAVDASANLFIADLNNSRIRRVDGATGVITTVAGTGATGFSGDGGPATSASLGFPVGVAVDASGILFIADTANHRIRRVDAATSVITTVAGDGTFGFSGDGGLATSASLTFPHGVVVDTLGNLFIADTANHRIRRVDAATSVITTVAGTGTVGFSGDGGPATSASLGSPWRVTVDPSGILFIADSGNHRIRKVEGVAVGALTPIPSLTQWGLIALAGLMAAVLVWRLRARYGSGLPPANQEC